MDIIMSDYSNITYATQTVDVMLLSNMKVDMNAVIFHYLTLETNENCKTYDIYKYRDICMCIYIR